MERRAGLVSLAGLLFRARPARRNVVSKRRAVGHGSSKGRHRFFFSTAIAARRWFRRIQRQMQFVWQKNITAKLLVGNRSFIGKTREQIRDANLKALEATFQFIDLTIGTASSKNR
jgi:hypothetical protein